MTLVPPSFGQVPPQGGTSDSTGHIVLVTAPLPLPSVAPRPSQGWLLDSPGCARCPVPSPGPVLSPKAAVSSGHLACRPGCAGCSNQMRLACRLKQVPTRATHGPARPPAVLVSLPQPGGPSLASATSSHTPCPMEFRPASGRSKRMKDPAQLYSPASSLSIALLESAGGGGQAEGDKQD